MSTWLDHLPSQERAKIRQRLRSPAAYEKLREKVKGPEDLEREMEQNEVMAELKFALETEPVVKDALKTQLEQDIAEQGVEALFGEVPPDAQFALEQGNFDIVIQAPDESSHDQLIVIPEGNVTEKLPVTTAFSEQYVQQFATGE